MIEREPFVALLLGGRRLSDEEVAYFRRLHRICNHGKSFDVHCKECLIAGYCACAECEAGDCA